MPETPTDGEMDWFARRFQEHRPRLRAVAYRMLGSLTDADDVLQEAWIRSTRSDSRTIANVESWLVTVVGRVCIDMLRTRQARRESLAGPWFPEPVVSTGEDDDPEQASLVGDSVGLALMVVLENLGPAERLAFVLHDMFGVPFDEIASIVERSPAAARQLASRARRRVRGQTRSLDADPATQRRVVDAFLAASREGDFEGLLRLLDPDVVFRIDSGARGVLAPALLAGSHDVAEQTAAQGPRFAAMCEPAVVNGAAGIVARGRSGIVAVIGVAVIDGKVSAIDLILDPDKLAALNIDR